MSEAYNKAGLITALATFFSIFAFFFWLIFLYEGIDLKEIADKNQEAKMQIAGSQVQVPKTNEPWKESNELIVYGNKVYQTNCAVCHGVKGLGDGIAGKNLAHPPRNFVTGDWEHGGDRLSLFKSITQGIKGTSMASFSHLSLTDRWSLVHFIRSLTKNKVKDKGMENKLKALK